MENIFFIGIGGISMSALAKFFLSKGYKVGGSDMKKSEITIELERLGIHIFYGHRKENIYGYDKVVYNSAIQDDNPELVKARIIGCEIFSRAEILDAVAGEYKNTIAVCGSHGKTTVTAMTGNIFRYARIDFGFHLGGIDKNLGNCIIGVERNFFITEACEYKKNFLKLRHNQAVILNIDNDHPDCYKDIDEITAAFHEFAMKTENICYIEFGLKEKFKDIPCKIVTFGMNKEADYYADNICPECGRFSFDVYERGVYLCRIRICGVSPHTLLNALASVAVARCNNICVNRIIEGCGAYSGVLRRNEFLYEMNGCDFYADYCHHPTQIRETLRAFFYASKNNLYVIFQPHTYSRTKYLMKEFVDCFKGVDNLVIYDTYPAREKFDEEGSALTLAKNIKKCIYISNEKQLKDYISANCKSGDICLFLGAGDIYDIGKKIKGGLN